MEDKPEFRLVPKSSWYEDNKGRVWTGIFALIFAILFSWLIIPSIGIAIVFTVIFVLYQMFVEYDAPPLKKEDYLTMGAAYYLMNKDKDKK